MFQADLFAAPARDRAQQHASRSLGSLDAGGLPPILDQLAKVSERPRYAFIVLNLIAKMSGPSGQAGPFVRVDDRFVSIREWLCDAIAPMAHRDPRRIARVVAVRAELEASGDLPGDPAEAEAAIEAEVLARVRRTGLTHISRAVSDLVRAGLVTRHYQGFRVDHHNRGAQRHVVYTVLPRTRAALTTAM